MIPILARHSLDVVTLAAVLLLWAVIMVGLGALAAVAALFGSTSHTADDV